MHRLLKDLLLKDRRGIAAVEFALVTSLFLLPLFLGMLQVVTLYHAQAKVSALSGYMAEMVAMENPSGPVNGVYTISPTGTSSTSLQDVCNGAIKSMAPFPVENTLIYIVSVTQESGPNGLPAIAGNKAYAGTATYDSWEQDFKVVGGSCAAQTTTAIGIAAGLTMATTSPPALTNTPTGSAMINVPCDNAIIVKTIVTYPGPLGKILLTRPNLSSISYARWNYDTVVTELKASVPSAQYSYAATQVCNSNNTASN